jgi:intein/homing endonuclease
LLEGIGQNRLLGSELKALTPIKKSEMRELLRNAGIDKEYRELSGFGQYVYRDDMANIMVDAFHDRLKDYQYLYGNNIKLYRMMVEVLNKKSPARQVTYVKNLVKKLKTLDHRVM